MGLTAAFNSLPSLSQASKAAHGRGMEALEGRIREFILDNQMQDKYGIALLHRHFAVQDGHRLVDLRHVSAEWAVPSETEITQKYNGWIFPRTFRRFDEVATPYEFSYAEQVPIYDHAFMDSFFDLLKELGLDLVFGLRLLDDHDRALRMEVTEGKVNLMMPLEAVPEDNAFEALWIIGKDEDDRCHCREYCQQGGGHTEPTHGCS